MILSILIPTFNEPCTRQVQQLLEQLPEECEIVVADDGSTDENTKATNRAIASLPHCRLWEAPNNMGRAAIRNRLVAMAEGEWLLSLDASTEIIDKDFLAQYLRAIETRSEDVFVGGVVYPDECAVPYRLRWTYERYYRQNKERGKDQRVVLKTGNCLIRRKALQEVPFNERITRYGYEDSLLGEELLRRGYTMCNFPTRVLIRKFDRNEDYLRKMHESNRVLREYATELRNSSLLLQTADKVKRLHLTWLLRLWHRFSHRLAEQQLCSAHPSMILFQLWRLGDLTCV